MLDKAHCNFTKSNFFGGDFFKTATLNYGSEVIPACRIDSTSEAWYHLQSTLNKHNQLTSGSCIDMDEYGCFSRKRARGYPYKMYYNYHTDGTKLDIKDQPERNLMDNIPACFVLAFPLVKVYDSTATVGVGVDTLGSAQHMTLTLGFTAESTALVLPHAGGLQLSTTEEWRGHEGWEMLCIADTSRVIQFANGALTASV